VSTFREHFAEHPDSYVLIGGAAVDVLMEQAGLEFRATKDLDVVLFVEALSAEFGELFWDFIEKGGYTNRSKSTGEACFYRFHSPTDALYPEMIELFSRKPDGFELPEHAHLTPLPVDEEVSSLSAILLDDAYYEFVRSGVQEIEGLSLLGPEHLIPLKMKAWVDITTRRNAGEEGQGRHIKKHRNDVVRLYQLLPGNTRIELAEPIAAHATRFLDEAFDDGFEPKQIGVRATAEQIVAVLRGVYGVGA
jgi:hypothetical protein